VCVGEQDATLSETVDVGRLRIRMPVQTTDPVVQIIDRDKQDIGFFAGNGYGLAKSQKQSEKQTGQGSHGRGEG